MLTDICLFDVVLDAALHIETVICHAESGLSVVSSVVALVKSVGLASMPDFIVLGGHDAVL